MTLRLVTEARPIPWHRLSSDEKKQLCQANDWIKAVQGDANRKKPRAEHIDVSRSGRVLFIDGVRGAGKTSVLLTLLEAWQKKKPLPSDINDKEQGVPEFVPPTENLHVFLPVLDFDPLPQGMPFQGWLLEPWRRQAEELDKKGKGSPDSVDLTEQLAVLFERAVIGWTRADADGQGVVEKALAYQEQASGWLETQQKWREFVGSMVCQRSGCSLNKCERDHSFVFVVAIDDVDLQVEQLPQLLHAIRLLHHPNVAYVLTGNYKHLKFVLGLDYIRRHEHRSHPHRHSEQGGANELWDEIKEHSYRLRDAFLEKALPKSAIVTLPHLTFADVIKFANAESIGTSATPEASTWQGLTEAAHALRIITARKAQHAIDSHLKDTERTPASSASRHKSVATHKFLADVCGTDIEPEMGSDGKTKFTIRGGLTTRLGKSLRAWKGDGLKLVLTDQPSFEFSPDFDDTNVLVAEDAHGALLVQLLVEQKSSSIVAHGLDWAPEAGIATTQVAWKPNSLKVAKTVIFHWPWLLPPSASQALELGKLSQSMSGNESATSLLNLKEMMVAEWLLKNIQWWFERNGKQWIPVSSSDFTFEEFKIRLNALWSNEPDMQPEIKLWVRELYVMTAPYFGLPTNLAQQLREVLKCLNTGKFTVPELSREQNNLVGNAIIDIRENDLSSKELKELTEEFLMETFSRLDDQEKELWIESVPKSPSLPEETRSALSGHPS